MFTVHYRNDVHNNVKGAIAREYADSVIQGDKAVTISSEHVETRERKLQKGDVVTVAYDHCTRTGTPIDARILRVRRDQFDQFNSNSHTSRSLDGKYRPKKRKKKKKESQC